MRVSLWRFIHFDLEKNLTASLVCHFSDFTRLKLVQGKKQVEVKEQAKMKEKENAEILAAGKTISRGKENSQDITAQFDASDDAEVVF